MEHTTLGIALGEMFHRTAWLVRDTNATGRRRTWREIGAAAIDPVTGLNRLLTGDASRQSDKPSEFVPRVLGGVVSAGPLWRGSNVETIQSTAIWRNRLQFSIIRSYSFLGNAAFHSGAQSVEISVGGTRRLPSGYVTGADRVGRGARDDADDLLAIHSRPHGPCRCAAFRRARSWQRHPVRPL